MEAIRPHASMPYLRYKVFGHVVRLHVERNVDADDLAFR